MVAISAASARLCFEEALAYAREERKTFGKRLADHQVIRHKLVEMSRQVNATQALLEMLAWRLDDGQNPVAESAKRRCRRRSHSSSAPARPHRCSAAVSYLRGNVVERLYREVRVQAIGGGSEEIMRDLAARQMGI